MAERLITPVSNNMEKYYTYSEYISKYNWAMRGEFYFEALLIAHESGARKRELKYHGMKW